MKGFKSRLIFNDVDFSEFGIIEDVRIPLISISNYTGELPSRSGVVFRKNKLNSKKIEVDLRIIKNDANNFFEIENNIKKAIYTQEPKKLQLREYEDKYFLAVVDGDIDFEKFRNTGFITFSFISLDGLLYSKTLTQGFNNKGNITNYWNIKGTISSSLVKIIKSSTLEKVQIDTSKYINQIIEIDSEKEMVKINDNLVMNILHFDSDFFMLELGENEINISGLSDYKITNIARWI